MRMGHISFIPYEAKAKFKLFAAGLLTTEKSKITHD